jgi:succinate-semialdehyde dehydrogenase/glutarate-semialdehyde dehydrogenase
MTFVAIDPTDGQELERHPDTTAAEVEDAVRAAHEAWLPWRETSFGERARRLRAMADLLEERSRRYAELMTREMGKPVTQAESEARKCAEAARWCAEHAEEALAPVPVETGAHASYWAYRPLGVILGIMPWNFPFWQVVRFAAPALAAGNAALLKHAPNVPGCARALEELLRDAGFPEGLFASLFLDDEATESLVDHPLVRGVSLTGSVGAGRAVAARAGRALKPCVLELGGSDPSVVLADADVEAAAESCVRGRLQNTGQSCIAAKRFVVVDEVREAFQERVTALLREANEAMGDPMDPGTRLGPMAREDLRDHLHDQVRRSVEKGARLELGGEVPERDGWWYPATLLTEVTPEMPAWTEELFGPVAVLIEARSESDAVRIANDTDFGLGAAVYTGDRENGERLAREALEAGNCFVNGIVRSDPRLPFGGVKDSGVGRELSPLGLRAFTNAKTVWVE